MSEKINLDHGNLCQDLNPDITPKKIVKIIGTYGLDDARRSSIFVNVIFVALFITWLWGMSWTLDQLKSFNYELDSLVVMSDYADGISTTFSGAVAVVNGDTEKGKALIAEGDQAISAARELFTKQVGVSDQVVKSLVAIELEGYRFHTEIEEVANILGSLDKSLDDTTRLHLIKASQERLYAMVDLSMALEDTKKNLYKDIASKVDASTGQLKTVGILMFLGIILMASGLMYNWFFMRRLILSLRNLSFATRKIIDGDMETRIEVARADEVSGIAEAFNEMVSGLKYNIECREHAESKYKQHAETLQAIMDNTPFGIWLTDPSGHPIFVNDRLCQEMGLDAPELLDAEFIGDLFDQQVKDEFREESGRGLNNDKTRVVFPSITVEGKGALEFKVSRVTVRDDFGEIAGFVGIVEDITDSKMMKDKLSYQETHDSLTGLLNRDAFIAKLDRVCANTKLTDSPHALCYFDLDQFKIVNDLCGHYAGDALLRQLASLFKEQLRKTESVYEKDGITLEPALSHLGADEFCLLLYNCSNEDALKVAQKIIDISSSFRFTFQDKFFNVGCSVGVVPIHGQDSSVELMRRADCACYVAKEKGRGRVHLSKEDDQYTRDRLEAADWGARITEAVSNDGLILFQQQIRPVNDAEQGDRFEVLVRYKADDGSIITPGEFLPAAERFSLMPQIDRWIINKAFDELEVLYGAGRDRSLLSASINLSGQTLGESWLNELVTERFSNGSIRPEQICFEVTETSAILNIDLAIEQIARLRDLGCKFSLDDFGAGLSSFSYLKKLHVDYLKIDGALIKNINSDSITREMVVAIHKVAQVMGIQTVAEFVENDSILAVLNQIGIDYAQGYGIARPRELIMNGRNTAVAIDGGRAPRRA